MSVLVEASYPNVVPILPQTLLYNVCELSVSYRSSIVHKH